MKDRYEIGKAILTAERFRLLSGPGDKRLVAASIQATLEWVLGETNDRTGSLQEVIDAGNTILDEERKLFEDFLRGIV